MTTAIYARQSINKKDSISIETQIEICKKEIRDSSSVKVYTDKGFSGKNVLRPSFQQLMSDIKRGLIQNIVVYRLDRISRSVVDFANIIDILNKYNVDFISANEKFDTSTPVGKAMLYIVMVFAQLERETIAERIKDNYYQRGTEGVWVGGPAPFGFKNTKITLNGRKIATIEPTEDLTLVKRIFEEYSEPGISLSQIAGKLINERGEMWNNIKLSRILHNPAYVMADADIYNYYASMGCIIKNNVDDFNGTNGLNIYGKRSKGENKYNNIKDHNIVIALHKGIIPSELFLKVQYKLKKNVRIGNNGKSSHTWLTGLIKCGYCGRALVVRKYKNTRYFNCSGRALKICNTAMPTIYADDVEKAVYNELREYIKGFQNIVPKAENTDSTDANNIKIKLVKVDTEINDLLNNLSSANETLIMYANDKIIELNKRRQELLSQLDKINAKRPLKLDIPHISDWDNESIDFKKDIAQLLIDKILIFNDRIEIHMKP